MATSLHTIGSKKISIQRAEVVVQYMAQIEFGMISKGCKNFGICRVEPITDMVFDKTNKKFENLKTLTLVRVHEKQKVEMYFLNKGMTDSIKKIYFGRANFLIGEDVRFTAACPCNHKPFTREGYIKKGTYPIERRPWGYFVSFSKR